MPAIAQQVRKHNAAFYWHLGDLRATYSVDEDMQKFAQVKNRPLNLLGYQLGAWDDFIQNQIVPFGDTLFFLGIGNHETIYPKTREQFLIQFADWLDSAPIREQRLKDSPDRSPDHPEAMGDHKIRTYYHWVRNGIDFINLDNASEEQFDYDQMQWFKKVIAQDAQNASIHTVVLGMHAALPDSISADHSMNEWATHEWYQGESTGREVYLAMVDLRQNAKKHVYLLSSHSHYYMAGIYNTDAWRKQGKVLPGWIVGTGGAIQDGLPAGKTDALEYREYTYGYLLATAHSDGSIDFAFQATAQDAIPESVKATYTQEFVDWCYQKNRRGPVGHDH